MNERAGPTEGPPENLSELDLLMEQLGRAGYLFHAFQVDRQGPDLLAATRQYVECADVVTLFDQTRAVAWRCPTGPAVDVFAPAQVYWSYASSPVWTLRALLTLAPPGHPEAPRDLAATPSGLGLPVHGRLPVQVRRRRW
ncbi:MAG TPA: hypothetical protein VFV67_24640 [Actinophytocola sp.]|uniref:hypothetical protein n=1 Tax=Actinophytocola sp. TaxID=1872138 RepID=UPI002DB75B74|nr:hypothetical protein [Actinophytocola sp.]HEU5473846.1 hypothetical protein [Actinophytocola sp.]